MATREQMARWYRPDGTIDQHGTHHHRSFGLRCADFEAMLARANTACEICGREDVKLQIDHRNSPVYVVRGLLCPKCNTHMKYIDAGTRAPDEATLRYVAGPQLWDQAKAAERGEPLSDVIRKALERYVKRP